jgi:2-polyprenyl-3-methyl-5-hydroxy-6-metoxy-1,4-benzoquinol methylase
MYGQGGRLPDTRYSYNVDLTNPTTSHSLAVLLVPPGSTVLDIGAADGSVARPLVARGCRVWGIESDADAAEKARAVCERVIVGDVEQLDLETDLEGRRFDVVLLLDVLEHLHDPLAVLTHARQFLAPGGRVITSIPNVAHGAVRLSLMSGTFTYTETGLLDKTHLRFFDRRSAEALIRGAGLHIVERLRVSRGLTETEIPVQSADIPPQILQMLESDDDATTYQFVFAAEASEGAPVPQSASLAERLQRRAEELEKQYLELQDYARSLEKEHEEKTALAEEFRRVRTELQSELEGRVRELGQSGVELRHLRADLAIKEAFIVESRETANRLRAEQEQLQATLEEELRRVRSEFQSERSEFQAERAELQSSLEGRTQELVQRHLELRHLQADLAVKEAFIAHLRQNAERVLAELRTLRVYAHLTGFRIVQPIMTRLSRYPRTYGFLRRIARRAAGHTNA